MPLLKRKPVLLTPLPPLSAVLQPLALPAPQPEASTSSPVPQNDISPNKSKAKSKAGAVAVAIDQSSSEDVPIASVLPPDGKDDDEQLNKLLSLFRGEMPGTIMTTGTGSTRGKRARQSLNPHANANGAGKAAAPAVNGNGIGEAEPAENGVLPVTAPPTWRVTDRECWYIEETGEIFTDFESYSARRAFYSQSVFQCEVSGKTTLDYFTALQSEQKEVRQLHSRFPRQLKKAVLSAVQFQIEGKLETLADKIFERFHNRFFDEEKVFVDVQGDKYLARIVKTFPPRSLAPTSSPIGPTAIPLHPYATDLSLTVEELDHKDDPMKYFYNVRLIEEGAAEGIAADYASANGYSNGPDEDDEKGEKWQASTMEVQADSISRDRINFSRAMLKRFIRDCVVRDAAVYSPWLVKPSVAQRYGLPTEMSAEVRERISTYKERQMDKRKREREERLGITHEPEEEEKPAKVTKKQKKEDEKKAKEEEKQREKERLEEEERKKKKTLKYPAEDLLVEWQEDKDRQAGRTEIRAVPNKSLPFGDQFEKFLLNWSFLNVMGKPLGLSPFSLDDFEQSLYHNDPWTNPAPLITEIHATLLNALIGDLSAGNEAVKPLSACGRQPENDTDYWEGKKGATTETLQPVAAPLAESWKGKELSTRDSRKGWEGALVGCLWDRATLETLPNYLDNILHLTFEDKPAPTRPTWSTGPSSTSNTVGLIQTKPEKRYSSLHHSHKLEIINFLIELVAQTAVVRDYLEESTAALTEVRKDQVEAKRELRRIQAEKEALEPKPETDKPKEEGAEAEGDVDGDVSMSTDALVKAERRRSGSPSVSLNGVANGTKSERDELEDSLGSEDGLSDGESGTSEHNLNQTAASRRRAMKERALEREAEENLRTARAAKEREDARVRKLEGKHIASEKKRLQDDEDAILIKLRLLEYDFRANLYALRARPLGYDRFGNKIWWLDGLGSSQLSLPTTIATNNNVGGTGRLYIQGVEDEDCEMIRITAGQILEEDLERLVVEERRDKEEGIEGRLDPGQWASYDSIEQLHEFIQWLNPRGIREHHLLKSLKMWLPELEATIKRRRIAKGLDVHVENDEPRRMRPSRKTTNADDDKEGYMNWKNRRALGKE